ncbi:MAG: ABC transporter substrate-binding protein [Solirubrobacterales bacterium]
MSSAIRPVALALVALLALFGLSACGKSGGKEGGTLTASAAAFPDYLDPALSQSAEGWNAMYDTYIPLLTYAHASGKAGSQVIPGLARSMPKISDGGRTYTLTLRKGLKYSNGRPVKASDFPAAVERLFKVNSGGSPFYTDIVGAEKFAETKQGGIPGIEADDASGEIVIRLASPRSTFTDELAMPYVALLPAGTPARDLSADPPPATGPYVITSSKPGRGWEYARNPVWKTTNAALMPEIPSGHVDEIQFTVVRNGSTQVNDVEQGRSDWMQNAPPADRYAEVKSRFDGKQFRVEDTNSTYFFWLGASEPPFNDVKVRQAANYAINREALERIYAGQLAATEQILPPGMPGYEKFDLYPYSVAKAKKLIAEADPSDRQVTVWSDNESPNNEAAEYVAGALDEIGLEAKLKVLNPDNYFSVIGNASTPDLDVGYASWFQDYPHPNDFFQPLLSEAAITPTDASNLGRFADPKLNAQIERLSEQPLDPKSEAAYADLDREFMEQAPWIPYGTATAATFVSSAIDLDKIVFNPTFSQDLTSFQFK